MKDFNYFLPVKIKFGRDLYKEVANFTNGTRVMLVSDPVISTMPYYDEMKQLFSDRLVACYETVMPNPEITMIEEGVCLARDNQIDAIIGVGGGSVMDTAKMMAALSTEDGHAAEYFHGKREFPSNRLELILLPTTAGTGSEVTSVAVVNDEEADMKKPVVSPTMFADICLIDAALTDTMPQKTTAVTGFDAFCHAIESYWATSSNPISESIDLYAIDLIMNNLKKAYDNGSNSEARDNMALASVLAGIGFSQTRTTVLHGLSNYLTAHFHIDHGIACAFALVDYMKYNNESIGDKMTKLALHCGHNSTGAFIEAVEKLYSDVNLPKKLSEYGVTVTDVDKIVEEGMNQPTTQLNPRPITSESMKKIVMAIL